MVSLSSPERVRRALERREVDRVPHFEWVIDDKVVQALAPGASEHDFVELMDIDGVIVFPDDLKTPLTPDTFRDEWGVVRRRTDQSYPFAIAHPIEEPADLDNLQIPDPCRPERFASLDRAVQRFKGKKAIIFRSGDVFSIPRYLRGMQNLLMDFHLHPQLLRDMIEIAVQYNSAQGREGVRRGADVIFTGDDFADNHGPMMRPEHFREFLYPAFKRVVAAYKGAGAYMIKHCDGDLYPVLDLLADSGIDCLDPIDPLAGMDIADVKRRYGRKICLKGNVDCAGALAWGTPEEVAAETRACIAKAAPGGGFILSSSNSIHSGVKPENYLAMLKTWKEFGAYRSDN